MDVVAFRCITVNVISFTPCRDNLSGNLPKGGDPELKLVSAIFSLYYFNQTTNYT